jgi:hypothetical protein
MRPTATGLGAGSRELPGVPNVLRLTLGVALEPQLQETVVLLETSLDDVTGEYLSHASEVIMDAGAKDVNIVPMIAKKGRPGYILRVLSAPSDAQNLCEVIMTQTGTLGVRMSPLSRSVARREVTRIPVSVGGKRVSIAVKVSKSPGGRLVSVKPEYDEVLALSKELHIPARLVFQEVTAQANKLGVAPPRRRGRSEHR